MRSSRDVLTVSAGTRTRAVHSTFQWERCNSTGAHCSRILGANARTYAIQASDVRNTLRVVVSTDRGRHTSASVTPATAVVSTSAPAVGYYVAQAAHGRGNGSSCTSAATVSTLNTRAEWKPGNVIGLCGMITSNITAHGSGASGAPITLYFEPGSSISQAACPTACLTLSNESYITVDGGQNGIIQNTANGTGLSHSVADAGILADPCHGCTIENLTIKDIYVRTSTRDTSPGASGTGCLDIAGSNVTVANNTMEYAHWCVYVDENHRLDTNMRFYGNNISETDHGIALAWYNDAGTGGSYYFYDNYVHDYASWDTGWSDNYHHDGFHSYVSGTGTPDIAGLYIYDNVWGGNVGQNDTAQIYLSGLPSIAASSPVYVFNNVVEASGSGGPANDYFTLSEGAEHVYNNTILGNPTDSCLVFNNASGGTAALENNLISGCESKISNSGATNGSITPDYNLYATASSNAFDCNGTTFGFSGFSSWRSCISGDSHSTTTSNAMVNSDGSLQSGSPAMGAGTNLYSICNAQPNPGLGALCENIAGAARPANGAWNAGAY